MGFNKRKKCNAWVKVICWLTHDYFLPLSRVSDKARETEESQQAEKLKSDEG